MNHFCRTLSIVPRLAYPVLANATISLYVAAEGDIESKNNHNAINLPRWFAYKDTLETLFGNADRDRMSRHCARVCFLYFCGPAYAC